MENLETRQEEEGAQEKYSSKISMEFFRHDEKEKAQLGQSDEEVRLTEKGKKHSRSLSKPGKIKQAVVFGSTRKRSKETAALIMAGEPLSLTGNESLEDLEKVVNAERKYGTKIGTDLRLDFVLDEKTQYGKDAMAAFKGGRWLKFLVEESDDLAEKLGDTESMTYSTYAANIAKIVEKYITIAPRFDSLVKEKGYDDEMRRVLGSHQGVLEPFLAKVIEKTKGKEELDRFVSALKNQGFGFSEGFRADIETINGQPVVKISYDKKGETPEESFSFEETVNPALIQEIINEGPK